MLQRHRELDQAGDSGRGFQVTDVGLHRTDAAAAARPARRAPSTAPSACTSIGSPSDVPVPCASTKSTSCG